MPSEIGAAILPPVVTLPLSVICDLIENAVIWDDQASVMAAMPAEVHEELDRRVDARLAASAAILAAREERTQMPLLNYPPEGGTPDPEAPVEDDDDGGASRRMGWLLFEKPTRYNGRNVTTLPALERYNG